MRFYCCHVIFSQIALIHAITYTNNSADDTDYHAGGALYSSYGFVDIQHSVFTGNSATHLELPFILVIYNPLFKIVSCRFAHNVALRGGAVNKDSCVIIKDSTFYGNKIDPGILTHNYAISLGGAVSISLNVFPPSISTDIFNSTFAYNSTSLLSCDNSTSTSSYDRGLGGTILREGKNTIALCSTCLYNTYVVAHWLAKVLHMEVLLLQWQIVLFTLKAVSSSIQCC